MYGPDEIEVKAGAAAELLKKELSTIPRAAVVMGTGWGGLADGYPVKSRVEFGDIPGFGTVTAPGHAGSISVVETSAGPVLLQDGRFHCYVGYS
ncbi:MAG: purine-nucleoside phosphorylase, partial [Candidatus Geothermincolia bacterium]